MSNLVGKKITNFKLSSTSEEGNLTSFSLRDCLGKITVLFFYPKDNTPGCTLEAQGFNELLSKFSKLNVLIFGISRDSIKSHHNFKCKLDLKFQLLSDEDEIACKLFDVIKEKNMYGKKVMGIERSTFVLDESLKVIGEFRKIKAEGHADFILDFIKKYSSKL